MTHNNEETYPRLGDVVAFVAPEHALEIVEAIVTIHRDFGDRTNRKHARLKYVLQERGVAWFRAELQSRVSFPVESPRPMPAFRVLDPLGWNDQGDGKWFLGLPIDSGRIINQGESRLRDGLRVIIERFNLPIRLTAQQNILLVDIDPADRPAIEALLAEYHIRTVEQISGVRRLGLACPALPTCGLAIAEAERALPGLINQIETALREAGLPDEPISMRMTGCPNGCARPYMAEIGIVGRSLDKYTLFLGGSDNGTRLNKPFLDLVHIRDIPAVLRPVFEYFRDTRSAGEAFGDFCERVGVEALRALTDVPVKS